VFIDEVGFQSSHFLPTIVKLLSVGVGARTAHNSDVGIPGPQSVDKRFQSLGIELSPLFITDGNVLQVEGGRVAHVAAEFAPMRGHRTVGKFHQVEGIPDVGFQVFHLAVLVVVVVFELARHAAVENRQRLSTDLFAEEKIFVKAQSQRLVIVGEAAVGKGVIPAVDVQGAVLDRADRVFPLVAGVDGGALHNASSRKSEKPRLDVGKGLHQIFPQSARAVLPCFGWKQADMVKIGTASPRFHQDTQACLRIGDG